MIKKRTIKHINKILASPFAKLFISLGEYSQYGWEKYPPKRQQKKKNKQTNKQTNKKIEYIYNHYLLSP